MSRTAKEILDTIWHIWIIFGMLCIIWGLEQVRHPWFCFPWILINLILCKLSFPNPPDRIEDAKIQQKSCHLSKD